MPASHGWMTDYENRYDREASFSTRKLIIIMGFAIKRSDIPDFRENRLMDTSSIT